MAPVIVGLAIKFDHISLFLFSSDGEPHDLKYMANNLFCATVPKHLNLTCDFHLRCVIYQRLKDSLTQVILLFVCVMWEDVKVLGLPI
jgi:hypothetical protein